MSGEEPPIVPSEEDPDPNRREPVQGGEEVPAAEVPVDGDFEVTRVVRYPEDTSVRDRIREEYGENSGPSVHLGLGDAGVGRPAASSGRKGRSSKKSQE